MANVTVSAATIGSVQPDAPTGLATSTAFDGVQLDWVNPTNTALDYIQVVSSVTNDRAAATQVANIKSTAFYDHSTTSGTRYYWVRGISTLGNVGLWNAGINSGTAGSPQEVTITSPVIGQTLVYSGTAWVNAPLGLPAGTGSTVTQLTSKTTGVTIDALTGQITTNNSALAAGFGNTFTVTNSTVTATDSIITNIVSGAAIANRYHVQAHNMTAGTFDVSIRNLSGVSLSEAVVISYLILRGQTA